MEKHQLEILIDKSPKEEFGAGLLGVQGINPYRQKSVAVLVSDGIAGAGMGLHGFL
ncbi:MAG: hypothetical protein AABZ02_12720 [Bacteroidota bacterium]